MVDKFTKKRYLTKDSNRYDEKKKFSGNTYIFSTWHPIKSEAIKTAKQLRELGYLARVEKHVVKNEGTTWLVWRRNPRVYLYKREK
jgi:hypothetical protein